MAAITTIWLILFLAFNAALGVDHSTHPTKSPLNKAVNLKAFADLLIKTHGSSKHDQPSLELAELTALWSRLLSNNSSSSTTAAHSDSLSLETCHKIEGPSSPVCQFASKVNRQYNT